MSFGLDSNSTSSHPRGRLQSGRPQGIREAASVLLLLRRRGGAWAQIGPRIGGILGRRNGLEA